MESVSNMTLHVVSSLKTKRFFCNDAFILSLEVSLSWPFSSSDDVRFLPDFVDLNNLFTWRCFAYIWSTPVSTVS